MSIVPLRRVTLYGLLAEKEAVLRDLQELGCLHLVALREAGDGADEAAEGPSPDARNALKYLLACRQRRRQVHDPAGFDAEAVQADALAIQRRAKELSDERDALERRIEVALPWGDFALPPAEDLGGVRLWFHVVPHYRMGEVAATGHAWVVVRRDNRFYYVVVLAPAPPEGMPVERVDPGARPLSELRRRLDAVEIELEDLQARRAALTRWIDLFAQGLARLEDRAALAHAGHQTRDEAPLFAIQGWAPGATVPDVAAYAAARRLALVVEEPGPDDAPPTLMDNPEPVAGGQELVSFYSTPGYWNWDPSPAVFASFALFFAMILSDAGYALLFGAIVALSWRRLGTTATRRRLRRLFAAMTAAGVAWGVLAGGYFGIPPPPGSILAGFRILRLDDFDAMMRLSILIGVAHVALANLGSAWYRRRHPSALAPLGWAVMVLAAAALWLAGGTAAEAGVAAWAPWIIGAGALGVLLFSRTEGAPWRRLLGGLLALARVPNAFGDVLSYLRLFALGLASASLALAFNDLAADAAAAVPGIGILLAVLIVVVGHALNFGLAVVSGFVHGLRLNFIEFFNWSLSGDGHPFRPFARRETAAWTRSS